MEEGRKEEEKEKEKHTWMQGIFFSKAKVRMGSLDVHLLFLSRVGLRETGSLQGKKVEEKKMHFRSIHCAKVP